LDILFLTFLTFPHSYFTLFSRFAAQPVLFTFCILASLSLLNALQPLCNTAYAFVSYIFDFSMFAQRFADILQQNFSVYACFTPYIFGFLYVCKCKVYFTFCQVYFTFFTIFFSSWLIKDWV